MADAEFTDAGGGKIVVAAWQGARASLNRALEGAGVAVAGCSAALESDEVNRNVWPGAHFCTTGVQAQSLTSLDATGVTPEVLTSIFAPGRGLSAIVEAEAPPACAAALAGAAAKPGAISSQINR